MLIIMILMLNHCISCSFSPSCLHLSSVFVLSQKYNSKLTAILCCKCYVDQHRLGWVGTVGFPGKQRGSRNLNGKIGEKVNKIEDLSHEWTKLSKTSIATLWNVTIYASQPVAHWLQCTVVGSEIRSNDVDDLSRIWIQKCTSSEMQENGNPFTSK